MRPLLVLLISLLIFGNARAIDLAITADTTGKVDCCLNGSFFGKIIVQQFRWNKWVSMYSFGTDRIWSDTCVWCKMDLHSGLNQFRLVATPTNPYQDSVFSGVVKVENTVDSASNCGFATVCGPGTRFTLKKESYWEIYDHDGVLVKKGTSVIIPVGDLPKGGYHLNFDNCTAEFFRN